MLDIYLPEEYDTYVKEGCLRIEEDTILHITDNVELRQITLSNDVDALTITGEGALTVDASALDGIAIGNNGSFGLSFGRWTLPRKKSKIIIDVHSITTKCDVEGCGIGAYGYYAITSDDFTPNCKIRNTPIDMHIILEHLEGSTKYTKRPEYITDEAYNKRMYDIQNEIACMWFDQDVNLKFINNLKEFCDAGDRDKAKEFVLAYCLKYIDTFSESNYTTNIRKMSATLLRAIPMFDPDLECRLLMHLIYMYAALQEAIIFDEIYKLPLAMRYLSCIWDMYSDFRLFEQMDPKLITDLHDLNLPEKNIYGISNCENALSRNLYNMFQIVNYTDDCNEVINPVWGVDAKGILYTNFYMHTVLDTYASDQYNGLVICTDKDTEYTGALWICSNAKTFHNFALPLDDRITVNNFIKYLETKDYMDGLSYKDSTNSYTIHKNVLNITP